MCGRTACTLAPEEIARACAFRDKLGRRRNPDWRDGDQDKYRPSFNKCPQSNSPVLVSRKHFEKDADSAEPVLTAMRWGLVPSWFRESDPSKMPYSTSNCRSEGMTQKKSYKEPLFKGQRCVVLADGFYEWKKQTGQKQPYFIYFPQSCKKEETDGEDEPEEWQGWRMLTMAGLFDSWQPPNGGEPLYTYTVITVDASKAMDCVHDRMPAILDGDDAVRKWLDYGEVPVKEAVKLIEPTENISLHPVSTVVNNSRNNLPECIKPIELGVKKEAKPTPSSQMMMNWLKNGSPIKQEKSQSAEAESPKKSSVGLMQMWLKKSEEPEAKKPRTA
uniref:Abasic site processing protein HMCES n=1 Tax=Callorhinchus milii TaxID=7868 RepID=A0A4W3K2R1_CALMI|eukprot:gi/632946363/ref/XP_007888521.1/ PREDICTED: embryonic stem cell-specific 5-hydroxymethylcytosine-binding protein [Callorhinchus milii]